MRRHTVTLAVAGVLTALAPVRAGDEAADLKKMEGTWRPASYVVDGRPTPRDDLGKIKLVVGPRGAELVTPGKSYHGTYKLYPDRSPKALDITITEGPDRGKRKLAVYEFRGDTLRFCVAPFGSTDRPTEFASKPGSGVMLEVWRRAGP